MSAKLLVFGLYAFLSVTPVDSDQDRWVAAVDWESLAAVVVPGSSCSSGAFVDTFLVHCLHESSGQTFDIHYGIYDTERNAYGALTRFMPSAGVSSPPGRKGLKNGFLSVRGVNVVFENTALSLQFGADVPLGDRQALWLHIYETLQDPAIVTFGAKPDETIKIRKISKVRDSYGQVNANRASVIFESSEEVVSGRWYSQWIDKIGDGLFEANVGPGWWEGHPTLRVPLASGRIVAIPLKEQLEAAEEVVPSIVAREKERARLEKYGLTPEQRAELFERIRRGEVTGNDLIMTVERLREEKAEDSLPMLYEIIAGDYDAKGVAAGAIVAIAGAGDVENYRRLASDTHLPDGARRMFLMGAVNFGGFSETDLALARRIAAEVRGRNADDTWALGREAEMAVERIQQVMARRKSDAKE